MPELAQEAVQVLKEQVFGSQSSTQSPTSQTDTANTDTNSNSTDTQTQATGTEAATTTATTDTTQQAAINDADYLDQVEYLKQNFGFDSVESAKEWIGKQREFEKNPPKYEPSFANDEAKRWAEYFTNGKEDELYQNLHARQQVKNIDTLSDDQKIKLYIKMQNPLFDQELVDYQFEREYGFNEAEFKDEDGNITDPMAYRFAKIAAQQKMQNDISKASEYFNQYKSKIDLTPLAQQQAQTADEEYENYKQFRDQQVQSQKNLEETLSKITEDKVNYSYKFNDEASKLAFDINFQADKAGFENARKAAINYFDYLQQNYYSSEGQPMNDKFIRDIYISQNLDKFAAEIAKQAVNADRKWFLANQKNITDTTQRNYNVVVPDDLQRLKEQVFGKTG